jgi:hypothetical protein
MQEKFKNILLHSSIVKSDNEVGNFPGGLSQSDFC